MNLRSGYPFSLIKNGLPFDYPKLLQPVKTDVLVMGGGISGALTAHYLMANGIACTVVDGRSIGLGSTCASTAILQYEIDKPLHELVSLRGEEQAVQAYRLCAEAIPKLEQLAGLTGLEEYRPMQSLYFAAFKKHRDMLRKEFECRLRHGFGVEWLEENDIQQRYGFTAPCAILSTLAASTDAYLLTHHLLQYNIKRGLAVYDRTLVKKIRHQRNNVHLETSEGITITAKKMVYATGYEVVNYIDKPIVSLQSTYAIISESYARQPVFGENDTVLWNTAHPYLYMRTTRDKRILVGGRDELFYSPSKRDELIREKAKALEKDFKKLFLSDPFRMEFAWTGTFGSTKDGLPYIGTYKKLPHSYFALGFGGNGITFSQVAGEIIARQIKGIKDKMGNLFSFDRS